MQRLGSGVFSLALGALPLALTTIAACAATAPGNVAAPAEAATGLCSPDGLERFVGQPRNERTAASIRSHSGASTLRWVPEGTMVTMEYRGERVTVHLDRANRVKRVVCG